MPPDWQGEIEVDGDQALVCLETDHVKVLPGCTKLNRGQMRVLLTPAAGKRLDPRVIRKRILDSDLTYEGLRGRNP